MMRVLYSFFRFRRPKTVVAVVVCVLFVVSVIGEMFLYASCNYRNGVLRMALEARTAEVSNSMIKVGLHRTSFAPHHALTTPRTITKFHYGMENSIDKERALLAGNPRKKKGFITLGISTVRREKGNDLIKTVQSLITNMDAKEKEETTIVIFLADFDDSSNNMTLSELKQVFQGNMNSGLVRVIGAPNSFYPFLKGQKRKHDNPESKVKWRSNQNYDYAFLFKYSVGISDYYMQLEDDIVPIKGYLRVTRNFINAQKRNWVCLELSDLGYTGKVYHSEDLEQLAKMMMLFYKEQSPDVTFKYFNILLSQSQRITRLPTIFQRMGYHSSTVGKIQPLKDAHIEKSKQLKGDNPPAVVFTNFSTHEPYKPEFAYSKSSGYFWAKYPHQYDYYLLVFDRPKKVRRIAIATGSQSHASDILKNGKVEISPTLVTKTEKTAECANYINAGKFKGDGSFNVENVASLMAFDVFCIRITMMAPQKNWIVFREIAVFINPR